jgi:hypothetical protein
MSVDQTPPTVTISSNRASVNASQTAIIGFAYKRAGNPPLLQGSEK